MSPASGSTSMKAGCGEVRFRFLVVAIVLALASGGSVQAKDLSGVLRWFVSETRQGPTRADGYGGTLDLRFGRKVTPTLSYRLSVRYTTSSQQAPGVLPPLEDTTSSQVEPRLEFRLTPRWFELSLGDRWIRSTNEFGGLEAPRREENNIFARLRTSSSRGPQLFVDFDRRDFSTEGLPSSYQSRLQSRLSYSRAGWGLSGGRRRFVRATELTRRTTDENLLAITYAHAGASRKNSVRVGYSLNDLTERNRVPGQALLPVPRPIRQALSALDPTPTDGPLAIDSALGDENRSVPTAINIGGLLAGGQIGWNLGVELALADPVDVVDVWLANPIPAQNATRYQWSVYQSSDNQTWTLVTSAANREYDPFDGRFRLTFSPVTAPFLKVVNTSVDDTLGAVFVSEIEAFGLEQLSGTATSGIRTQTANLNWTWVPVSGFSATLVGFYNETSTEREGQTGSTSNLSGNLSLSFQPSETLVGNVAVLANTGSRGLEDRDSRTYSMTLTALPLPDLDITVAGNLRTLTLSGSERKTGSYLLQVSTLVYRDLSLSISYGRTAEQTAGTLTRDRDTWQATLNARPRAEVQLTSGLTSERVVNPAASGGGAVDLVNWTNRVTIRPSTVIGITVVGTYVESDVDAGWSTVAQADWSPFPGGAFQLFVDYRRDEPVSGQGRRGRTVRLRWNLNRGMFLDLDATRRVQALPDGTTVGSTELRAFFQARL